MSPKVMVIGLDGATMKLLGPWIEAGLLPNLAEALQRGCSGNLRSTVPPYTPPAWASFYTGVNPGKHGVFGFTAIDPATGIRRLVNSKIIGAKRIWQILNEKGMKAGLLNLPITYPPEEVDGFMVSGMMTPENASNYTYPASLASELNNLKDPYVVDVPVAPMDMDNLDAVKRLRKSLKGRHAACLHLMENHPCEFFMTVFIVPDRLQHIYWKYIDESTKLYHTSKGEQFRKEVMGLFKEMDDVLGDIFSKVDDDCRVFMMSDHGFTSLENYFYFNEWLSRNGYFNVGSRKWLVKIYQLLRISKLIQILTSGRRARVMKQEGARRLVDWEKTRAYAGEQGLFLNLEGREEKGSVPAEQYYILRAEIAGKLKDLTYPESGRNIIDSISFKEDIFDGPYIDLAADIYPVMDDFRIMVHDGVMRKTLLDNREHSPEGIHHPDGIFAAWGPGIRSGEQVEGANMVDMTPTILHALGLPVPEHMDGRVLEEIFDEDFISRNPVRKEAGDEITCNKQDEVFSEDEEKEIQEQLRGMGYM